MHPARKPFHGNSKSEVYDGPLPSRIAGDIIKEVVAEKPTYDRVASMLCKRFRMENLPAGNEEHLEQVISKSLDKSSLKEAVDYVVGELMLWDGHDRNLILTAAELATRNTFNNKKMILATILSGVNANQTRASIVINVNRQLAMRKLTNNNAEFMTQDILSIMIQKQLIQQKSVGEGKISGLHNLKSVVVNCIITDGGKQVLRVLNEGSKEAIQKAVNNFELRYNLA